MPEEFLKQLYALSISIPEHRDCGSYPDHVHIAPSARPAILVLGMSESLEAKGTLGLNKAFRSFGLSKEQNRFFVDEMLTQ